MDKFEKPTEWKTRGGWRAVVVRADGSDALPYLVWHDAELCSDDEAPYWHDSEGKHECKDAEYAKYALIEPWKDPIIHEGWVNAHDTGTEIRFSRIFGDKEEADSNYEAQGKCDGSRKACIEIKFTEGDGCNE